MPSGGFVHCFHVPSCNRLVSKKTRARHLKAHQELQARNLAAADNNAQSESESEESAHGNERAAGDVVVDVDQLTQHHPAAYDEEMYIDVGEYNGGGVDEPIWGQADYGGGLEESDEDMGTLEAINLALRDVDLGDPLPEGGGSTTAVPVMDDFDILNHQDIINEDNEDDSSSDSDEVAEEPANIDEDPPILVEYGNALSPELAGIVRDLDSKHQHSLSETDVRDAQFLQNHLNHVKEELSADEMDNLIAFTLRSAPGMTKTQYDRFRVAFNHRINLESTYKNNSLARNLSRLSSQEVDCCAKSCMAFTGEHAERESCIICGEARFNAQGKPRNTTYHFSIIDRLQGMFQDRRQSEALNRANARPNENPDLLTDKFDGDYFKELSQRTVKVRDVDTGYRYFSDTRDISLSVSLDGFTFFETVGKHTSKTKYNTWLVIAIIDNIDPLTRTHRKNIMVLGVIPGPGSPKDLNSFLHWFQRDLQLLSIGVLSWDAAKQEWFLLRAFLLWLFGDMPAIAHIMNMKGHNGICPCRACYIRGSRNVTEGSSHYYPVLLQTNGTSIDVTHLLTQSNRTHQSFLDDLDEIKRAAAAGRVGLLQKIQKETGVNGWTMLYEIDSVDLPRSCPHDLMHLLGLNTIPNYVKMWTDEVESLRIAGGVKDYLISKEDWKEVGRRGEEANKLIPYAFSRAIPNVASRVGMTADAWVFWFAFLAPYALDGILKEPYYSHAMELGKIAHTCLKYEITRTEVGILDGAIRNWVQEHERLYYQGREDHLAACPSTLHAWLHVPQDILNAGPSWMSWAYPMEREVQWAKAGVKYARRHPFGHMAGRALQREQIRQVGHRIGIAGYLDINQRIADSKGIGVGPQREPQNGTYGQFVLCSPRVKNTVIPPEARQLLTAHLAALYESLSDDEETMGEQLDAAFFDGLIPRTAEKWNKVRVAGGGDMANASSKRSAEEDRRDASFIRYHMIVDNELKVLYGQLQYILKVPVPAFAAQPAKNHIFALIKPCVTGGGDATAEKVYYTDMAPLGLADLTCFVATVGRVPMGDGRYGIVDRGLGEAWPTVYEDLPQQNPAGEAAGLAPPGFGE